MVSRWFDRFLRMPWATLLPSLVLLPFLLSGAVRFQTGASLGVGLTACLLAAGAAAYAARRFGLPRLTESSARWAGPVTLVVTVVLVAWMYRLWWTPLFAGMPNTMVGVDLGNHLKLYLHFLHRSHKQYEGFVGLYALAHWWKQVLSLGGRTDTSALYYGIRFAHYAALLALPVALASVAYASIARIKGLVRGIVTLALTLPFQLGVLAVVVFPVVQYYQAEGFYSQVVGLYPMLLAWLFYGLVEDVRARFVLGVFWLVVQRFSYGLNLGDMLVTFGYLMAWELHALKPAWLRWAARLFVPVAFTAAYVIFSKLYDLRGMHGYFNNQSVHWAVPTQLFLSAALLSAPTGLRSAGIAVSEASARLWRYAGTFGLFNSGLTVVYFLYDLPFEYYILKYGMYSVVLVSIASIGPLSAIHAHFVSEPYSPTQWRDQLRVLVASVVVCTLSVIGFTRGYLNYRAMAQERYNRAIPNATLFSNYEPAVDGFIARTLKDHKAEFGGYYDPFWPRMFVANAMRSLFGDLPDYYYNGDFNRSAEMFQVKPGKCYFVLGGLEHYHGYPLSPLRTQVATFLDKPAACRDFSQKWGTAKLSICAKCY
jgi:hypothetical protein